MEDNSGPHEATIDATILKNGPNSDKDSDNAVGAPPKEPPLPAAPAAPSAAVPVVEPMAPVDTYCSREARHRDREASGELQALYVQNDGAPMSGKLLIGLKNVFAKCLPNMPKTYITRLLFDRRHR